MESSPTPSRTPRSRLRAWAWLAIGLAVAGALLLPSIVVATPAANGEHKVTICHRTNSVTNPYVIITVDYSGADGGLVHDNGNGDHTSHLGPVFDFKNPPPPPHNGDQWGDIIPPFSWPGDANHAGGSYPGLNWPAGEAIYRAGCGAITISTTTVTSTTTATTTATVTSTVSSSATTSSQSTQ